MSTNSTQLSFPSRPRSRSRGSGLPRTLAVAAIAVVVMMTTVEGSWWRGNPKDSEGNSKDGSLIQEGILRRARWFKMPMSDRKHFPCVEVTGAGDPKANGWYRRRKHAEGPPSGLQLPSYKYGPSWALTDKDDWKITFQGNGYWYEKSNGYFIFLDVGKRAFSDNEGEDRLWKIRSNRNTTLYVCTTQGSTTEKNGSDYVVWHSDTPPTNKWQVAHFPDARDDPDVGPAPTLRVVNHRRRRTLVATSSETVEVTGAGFAQVNGLYHQMKHADGPPRGWPYGESYWTEEAAKWKWYEKNDGCNIYRSGSTWRISDPDAYRNGSRSRYECRVPARHDRDGAGPPSTKETSNYLRSYSEGWTASYGSRHPGSGGRAPVPTVRVVS